MTPLEWSEFIDHITKAIFDLAMPALFGWLLYELRRRWDRLTGTGE